MAEYLIPAPMVRKWVLLAGLVTCPVLGLANQMLDPTRPPSAFAKPRTSVADAPVSTQGLQLQSVLISPKRKVAIINGETLVVGDSIGESQIIRIMDTEVVLRAGTEERVVRMYPDFEKRSSSANVDATVNKHKK